MIVEHEQRITNIQRWIVKISLEDANDKLVFRFNFPWYLNTTNITITGLLACWGTRTDLIQSLREKADEQTNK